MKRLKLIALSLSALALSGPALACSCLFPETAQQQLENSGVVFLGSVVDTGPKEDIRPWYAWMTPWHEPSLSPWDTDHVTTFQVNRMLKGPDTLDTITFVHGVSSPSCGVMFQPQQSGVFIGYEQSDGFYSTSLCSSAAFPAEDFIAATEAKN